MKDFSYSALASLVFTLLALFAVVVGGVQDEPELYAVGIVMAICSCSWALLALRDR